MAGRVIEIPLRDTDDEVWWLIILLLFIVNKP